MIFEQSFRDNFYNNFLFYIYMFLIFLFIVLNFVSIPHFLYEILVVSKIIIQMNVQITQLLKNTQLFWQCVKFHYKSFLKKNCHHKHSFFKNFRVVIKNV